MTQKSEEARSTWITRWMGDLTQDLRHSFRGMRRDAGFTAFTFSLPGSALEPVPRSSVWSMRCFCARSRFAIQDGWYG
jgi:hypothetical protein